MCIVGRDWLARASNSALAAGFRRADRGPALFTETMEKLTDCLL
jgi:hypothetical protein